MAMDHDAAHVAGLRENGRVMRITPLDDLREEVAQLEEQVHLTPEDMVRLADVNRAIVALEEEEK